VPHTDPKAFGFLDPRAVVRAACKGNLMDVLSKDGTCREESSTEPALPVATPWLMMLDKSNRCNGAQAHKP
jgi:hypothetical protein